MEEQLPNMLTPVSAIVLAHALVDAWRGLWSETPKRESILVLLAQGALETGRWRSMHCWNLGNAKHTPGDGRSFTFYRCNEIIAGKTVWFDPPHPASCFRAFRSIQEGAVDYLGMLRRRFTKAWPAVLGGDPRAFVQQLKAQGYFTADEKPYENSVASLFHEFGGLVFEITPDNAPVDDATRNRVLVGVATSLREIEGEAFEKRLDQPAETLKSKKRA